jgi:hypothetical protein
MASAFSWLVRVGVIGDPSKVFDSFGGANRASGNSATRHCAFGTLI